MAAEYVALRRIEVQVQTPEGTRYEMRNPGDPVPEAANWPNPGLWVKRKIIKRVDGKPFAELPRRAPVAPRPLTQDDVAQREERNVRRLAGEQAERSDFPAADESTIGPGKSVSMADDTPAIDPYAEAEAADTADVEAPAADIADEVDAAVDNQMVLESTEPGEEVTMEALMKVSVKDLKDICDNLGIEYDSRANKGTLANLILSQSKG